MTIGENIRRLRRERDITQEELAERLCITAKAVSQWENSRTSPDISQIPALCSIFNVTSDELIGIDITRQNEECQKICDKAHELAKNGYQFESMEILKDGIRRYPDSYEIMEYIMNRAVFVINSGRMTDTEIDELREQCRRYAERILRSCTDDRIRYSAIDELASYYADKGDIDKAGEYVNRLPIMCVSSDFSWPNILKGDEGARSSQMLKYNLVQFLGNHLVHNRVLDSGEPLYSDEEIVKLHVKRIRLFELMFEDGDYGFYHNALADSHRELALYHVRKNEISDTLFRLHKAAEHAVGFVEYLSSEQFTHTSLAFKNYTSVSDGVMVANSDNKAMAMLTFTKRAEFDRLRDSAEFDQLIRRLTEYAGKNPKAD